MNDVAASAQLWWHRVHVPVEIKSKGQDVAAVQQLFGYMRQVLREQLDRRHLFGLTFCEHGLSVWLCDREGVIGTETAFNIHEVSSLVFLKYQNVTCFPLQEPQNFIKVIAAFALLPP